jgi:hypothetical protein
VLLHLLADPLRHVQTSADVGHVLKSAAGLFRLQPVVTVDDTSVA